MNERDAEKDLERLSFYDADIDEGERLGVPAGDYFIDAVQMARHWINEALRLREENERLDDALGDAMMKADCVADLAADSTEMLVRDVGIVAGLNELVDQITKALTPKPTSGKEA